jgi:hypothetical protein
MHPEILRELTSQRGREIRAQAQQAMLARAVRRTLRARRHGNGTPDEADEFAVPAIPDYVDGSFRTAPADDKAASQPSRVPASRRAA